MTKGAKQFEGVLDRYFERYLEDHPMAAANAGLKQGEGRLGRGDLSFLRQQEQRRRKALAELDQISPRDLSSEQQMDRLAVRARLTRESEDFQRGRHTLEPDAIEGILGILLHELMRGEDEPKRAAANLRSLLQEAPGRLREAKSLLIHPEAVWLRVMNQTAEGAPSLLAAAGSFLSRQGALETDAALLRAAARSITQYQDSANGRKPAPPNSFSVGAACLQRRVRDELGLDYTLAEVEALALSEVQRIGAELAKECRKIGRKATPESVIEEAREQWNPGGDLLQVYKDETQRVAEGFRAAEAVTFPPGETLQVRPVPEFMRSLFPTAAYTSPGAFERRQRGIFWVNDLSVTKAGEAERKAERAQHFGLSLTCAHEAYPGHHLQFVCANQHPRKWRRLVAHAVFYEGWTLWCEQMMADLQIDRSPWLRVQQLHDALWRCHRILVDLRLQTARYSWGQAARHMQRHLGFTRARAEADVNWYTSQPGVPMSYWLGRLENERLYRRLAAGRGWPLKKFNDWLLSFGTLPQAWIEKYGLD